MATATLPTRILHIINSEFLIFFKNIGGYVTDSITQKGVTTISVLPHALLTM